MIWKHEFDRTVSNISENSIPKTTVKNVRASPSIAAPVQRARGESDDSDNTDSEEEGYDSDVQLDRQRDYNQRLLINSDRAKSDKKDIQKPTTENLRPM